MRNWRRHLFVLCALALFPVSSPVPGFTAQSQDPPQQTSKPHTVPSVNAGPKSITGQLVEESREAAGENEQGQFKRSPSVVLLSKLTGGNLEYAYWLAVVINFAVVAAVIVWAWKKNLPLYFRTRNASIQRAMQEAQKSSEEARQRLAEIEARLSKLDAEISGMRSAAEKEAASEEERIRSAAGDDTKKVMESAEQEIVAAVKTARRELKEFAADLAVSLAKKQIHVDAATDQSLIHNFAEQLSGNGHEKS